uniref:Uncharacterized protein n=1 Tax=Octopus bimaculoides TaxID=37653 RepID=A0A0L8HCD2_OCTBM
MSKRQIISQENIYDKFTNTHFILSENLSTTLLGLVECNFESFPRINDEQNSAQNYVFVSPRFFICATLATASNVRLRRIQLMYID